MSADKEMGIFEHFNELRVRIFKALIALIITTLASFFFSDQLIQILARPIGGTTKLISIEVTENIGVFMRVSLLTGFIIALPVILYQLLAFIMPGLTDTEKRWVYMGIPVASVLFLLGVSFAYFIMLPTALPFLISFLTGVETTPRLSNYFAFVTNLLFWIGISFETPVIVFLLAKLGLVTPKMLLKYWRYAILVIAVIAAIVTPTPDPVNMGILMVPLIGLYFLSILFALFARRKKKE
ncbi:MAG TPA: twin-arginine translocase subunit TatC [Anaerolineaceae bacterium]